MFFFLFLRGDGCRRRCGIILQQRRRALFFSLPLRGEGETPIMHLGGKLEVVRERDGRGGREREREIGWKRMDRKVCECAKQANRISFHVAVPSRLSKYYFILNCKGRKSVLTTF